jgi:hypothetical protein
MTGFTLTATVPCATCLCKTLPAILMILCSLEVYKAVGIFDVEFQATEFTPKDLYTLAIFQEGTKENYPDCPELPEQVCQISGLYVAQFPDWNTIEPYDNMCNHCDSQWPEYERYPPQC